MFVCIFLDFSHRLRGLYIGISWNGDSDLSDFWQPENPTFSLRETIPKWPCHFGSMSRRGRVHLGIYVYRSRNAHVHFGICMHRSRSWHVTSGYAHVYPGMTWSFRDGGGDIPKCMGVLWDMIPKRHGHFGSVSRSVNFEFWKLPKTWIWTHVIRYNFNQFF